MLGSLLAGLAESPGQIILYKGRSFKTYRGMGSQGAMMAGSKDRYQQSGESSIDKLVPEGVEGRVPYKGPLAPFIYQLVGGLRAGMGYCGTKDIEELRTKTKFIQVSTDEVYGSIESGSWDENFPLKPNSPYAASKASADLVTLAYQKTYSLDLMISRCCNNYGPNQFPEKIIPLFITSLIQGKKIPVYGDGLNVREWIHVDDHCRGLELIFEHGKSGEIYNLGSHAEFTNLEVTNELIKSFGFGKDMINYVADRLGHDRRYSLNFEKASKHLGYKPVISFESGLLETIEWYKKNSNWWKTKV
jgi:dTDP-glucose 4,6-dehydratase